MFHFRKFSLSDDRSSMKIGTDAVLLGSWVRLPMQGKLLDIGTGSGILALMLAQRSQGMIDAIEINRDAAIQAGENVALSPWQDRIHVIEGSFQVYADSSDQKYGLIICNPPYFSNALKSPREERTIARHTNLLPASELFAGTVKLLAENGTAAFIFPAEGEKEWILEANLQRLYPVRICHIFGKQGKKALRTIVEFQFRTDIKCSCETLAIRDQQGNYTPEYKLLTGDFYLGL